jgi:hypothetical protein
MGVGSSIGTGNLSGSEVKNILNTILKHLLSRTDLVDLYSLADPARCSKYIVVGAKALEKLFLKINLQPQKGPDGKIYFQKITGITKANPLGEEQLHTCQALSFFFILIVRIFAGVTLSILDSELPISDPIVPQKTDDRRGVRVLNPPHLEGFKQKNVSSTSWFGRGGELIQAPFSAVPGVPGGSGNYYLDDNAGAYKDLLNKYLILPSGANPAMSTGPMRFQGAESLILLQETLYTITNDPAAVNQKIRTTKDFTGDLASRPRPTVIYNFKRENEIVTMKADLLVIKNHDQNYEVTLENINFIPQNGKAQTQKSTLNKRWDSDMEPKSKSGKELPGLLQELFINGANLIDPPKFSIMDFFNKFAIIDSNNTIKGTTIRIIDTDNVNNVIINYEGSLKPERGREIKVTIQTFISCKKETKIERRNQEYKLTINLNEIDTRPEELEQILRKRGNISNTFITGINDTSNPMDKEGRTIPQFLQKLFDRLIQSIEQENIGNDNLSFNREGRPKAYNSDKMSSEFRIKEVWEALRKTPPVKAHCVARAVQLLNVSAINDPSSGQAYSSVCRLTFPYITDGSLPAQKRSILNSEGIHAMSMLFFEMGNNLLPKLANMDKYKELRERLKAPFNRFTSVEQMREKSPLTPHNPEDLPFEEIIDTQMPFCTKDKKFLLQGAIIGRLHNKAQELLRQQKLHIARVMQIIFKLFDEKAVRAGNFEINDYILSTGIESLYKLAEEARNLLVDYYSNCEKTYTEGLMALYDTKGNPSEIQLES